jgi:Holliday junction resolvasome RuvABC endonuclease subunit
MKICGIDYSLSSPAICVHEGKEFKYSNCQFYFLTSVKKNATSFGNIHGTLMEEYIHECQRYDFISDWAMNIIKDSDKIAIEGYAYGASGRVFHIAENTGLLKYKIWQNKKPLEIITPSHVKKLATGKGNADKKMMYDAFVDETSVNLQQIISPNKKDIGSPVSDIVDSYYVCKVIF